MVEYRLKLKDYEKAQIMKTYPKHVNAYGGLFTSTMRQNLLGINPKNPLPYKDTPNFWSDVRKSVKNGLIDIQLVCNIASSDQLKKMFEHQPDYPNQGMGGEIPEEYHYVPSTNLISALSSIVRSGSGFDPKQDMWKADLAKRMISECLEFFLRNHLIRSSVHERHLSEVMDIISAEMGHKY
jgi:hypothetical protein